MRGALCLFVLAGCFAPSAPAGVPCDPSASHCPTGQSCVAGPDGFVCSSGPGSSGVDSAIDSALLIDAAIDGPPVVPVQKTYNATVGECIAPSLPSPTLCRMLNGNEQLVIDIRDSTTDDPWHGFIRFEIDNTLAGKTITKVVLRVVATNDAKAPGPDSGSVFLVQPFTLSSLSTTTPAKVGSQLAGTQGAVSANEIVRWTLPNSILTVGQPLYLGLYPNDDDGVNYSNIDGTNPPRLIIDAQ